MLASKRLGVLHGHVVLEPAAGLQSHSLSAASDVNYAVTGHVDVGFEPVREVFDSNFAQGLECGSQLCVYWKGKCIIDLVGCIGVATSNFKPKGVKRHPSFCERL